jgi:hypothetical protein
MQGFLIKTTILCPLQSLLDMHVLLQGAGPGRYMPCAEEFERAPIALEGAISTVRLGIQEANSQLAKAVKLFRGHLQLCDPHTAVVAVGDVAGGSGEGQGIEVEGDLGADMQEDESDADSEGSEGEDQYMRDLDMDVL